MRWTSSLWPRTTTKEDSGGADKAPVYLKLQRFPVSGELEIAASGALLPLCPHRTLPVDGAGARARVHLLVVHQRLQLERERPGLHSYRHRILGAGPRRAPAPQRREAHFRGLEHAHAAVGAAQRAARPEAPAVLVAHAKRHKRPAPVEVDPDPVPSHRALRERLARPLVVE